MGSQGLYCTIIMKVFAALLACAAMVSARNLKLDELEVGFCDGANSDVLSLNNISVESFPLVIATGADITLGSCDYDGDELLASASDFLCPTYFPDGQDCMLPLNPGFYGSTDSLTLTLPEIPGILVDLLAAGTYYADATVKYADGSEMTCLYIRVELSGH